MIQLNVYLYPYNASFKICAFSQIQYLQISAENHSYTFGFPSSVGQEVTNVETFTSDVTIVVKQPFQTKYDGAYFVQWSQLRNANPILGLYNQSHDFTTVISPCSTASDDTITMLTSSGFPYVPIVPITSNPQTKLIGPVTSQAQLNYSYYNLSGFFSCSPVVPSTNPSALDSFAIFLCRPSPTTLTTVPVSAYIGPENHYLLPTTDNAVATITWSTVDSEFGATLLITITTTKKNVYYYGVFGLDSPYQ